MGERVASNPSFTIQLRYPVPISMANPLAGRHFWKNLKNQVSSKTCPQVHRFHVFTSIQGIFSFVTARKVKNHQIMQFWLPGDHRRVPGDHENWFWDRPWRGEIRVPVDRFLKPHFWGFPPNSRSVAQDGIKHDQYEPMDGSWPLDRLWKTLSLNNPL